MKLVVLAAVATACLVLLAGKDDFRRSGWPPPTARTAGRTADESAKRRAG